MPQTKIQKQKVIKDLEDRIKKQKTIVFVDFTGLKVKDFSDLRKKMKKADSEVKVAKKTLLELAFKKAGINIDSKGLKGEVAVVFGFKDEIAPAKVIHQFSQSNPNLKIIGGIFENQVIESEKIIELAKLSSKEELLARTVGILSSPISNFIHALQFNLKGLIYLLSKIKT